MRACLFGVYIFLTHPLSKNLASYLQRHSFPIKFIYLKLGYNFRRSNNCRKSVKSHRLYIEI